jgi:hypothetical protein
MLINYQEMKTYTSHQMVVILKMYEGNNFNLNKTSKETGVARPTIRKWADSMGFQVFSHNKFQEIVFQVDEEITDKKAIFDSESLDAKLSVLRQIVKRISKTKNMNSLIRCLKILHELDRDVKALNIKY